MDLQSSKNFEDIRVVILIGPLDFGRCSLASKISPGFWLIGDKPAIVWLVEGLIEKGIKKISICSPADSIDISDISKTYENIEIKISKEVLPAGTAGTLKNAIADGCTDTLIVMPARVVNIPDIEYLISAHKNACSDMTVFFQSDNNGQEAKPAEIYALSSELIEYIPEEGYYDIKESFISDLARKNKIVKSALLNEGCGQFNNIADYISRFEQLIKQGFFQKQNPNFKIIKDDKAAFVLADESAKIGENVRFFGNVVISENVHIKDDTSIIGTVYIGKNSVVEKNCSIFNSVIWHNSVIARQVNLDGAVVCSDTVVASGANIKNEAIFDSDFLTNSSLEELKSDKKDKKKQKLSPLLNTENPDKVWSKVLIRYSIPIIAVFAVFLWSYWTTAKDIADIWQRSDEYSAGMLVPFLAIYVLWARREQFFGYTIKPSLIGLFSLIGIEIIRLSGLFLNYGFLERAAFVLAIGCLILTFFGWRIFFKTFTVFLFLFFMLPLPNRVNHSVSLQLQELSTVTAVWLLEVFGYVVVRQGNVINIGDTSVAVAEACNGLRMIAAFFIIASWLALLVHRKRWEKAIVILSALPIAILCNTIRLALTAVVFTMIDVDKYGALFHDWGGYAMMPLAVGLIALELWILSNLIVEPKVEKQEQTVIISRKR